MTSYNIASGQDPAPVFAGAVPGDIIRFAAGIHSAHAIEISCSGNSTSPIEIFGETGARLQHPDGQTGTGYAVHVTGSFLYIHDLIVEEAAKAMVLDGVNHCKLQRVEGRNTHEEIFKIRAFSSFVYVDTCSAHDSGSGQQFGEGFYIGDASSNWPNTSSPDTTNHIRIDNSESYRCYSDGVDCKEGAHDIVIKGHNSDFTQGNTPPTDAQVPGNFGNSGGFSRADRIQFVNCTVEGAPGYGFKCFDVTVGSTIYGRQQYVKGGSSTGHVLAGVGSQSDSPDGMHVYSDFTATAPRVDQVGGHWVDDGFSNLNPSGFSEFTWSSPASAYTPGVFVLPATSAFLPFFS